LNILGIIPSRYGSTRFPGKPLAIINGKSMIQRVYEQASKSSSLTKIVVATDDKRIFNHVKEFSGEAVMTSDKHQNGTERCAEALSLTEGNYDAVINIQGDEPFIQPEQIDLVAACLNEGAQIATLVKRIKNEQEVKNLSIVKAVVRKSEAIVFTREMVLHGKVTFKHIGIYGYRASVLREIAKLPPSPLEKLHSLEQMRWMENGYKIKVKETRIETQAVDTPEDLKKFHV
jgi:3-deoxy-manno-octulosonate cytidylyltransferase (CMP-KDO synthetase)